MDSEPIGEMESAEKEAEKWYQITSEKDEEYSLVGFFHIFEKSVNRFTSEYQKGSEKIGSNDLEGLWNMFMSLRKGTVDAYSYKENNPELFEEKIKKVGMQHIDSLFHALSFYEKDIDPNSIYTTLDWELDVTADLLAEEYGIETYIPMSGYPPDLRFQTLVSGSGEKITKVLQPGFVEKDTGKVIRDAVVETE